MWTNATPEVANQYGVMRPRTPQQAARGVGQVNTAPLAQIDQIRTNALGRGALPQKMPRRPTPNLQAALMALLPPQR